MSKLETNSLGSLMKHLSLKYSVITLDSQRSLNSQTQQQSPQNEEKSKKTYLKNINNFDSQLSLQGRRTQQKMNSKRKQKAKHQEQSKVIQNQNIEEYVYELHSRNEALRNELIELRQLAREQENVINIMASKLN